MTITTSQTNSQIFHLSCIQITKCHLSGGPAQWFFHHKDGQYFYGSAHRRGIQSGSCKQQDHVHPVDPGRSLHSDVTGDVGKDIGVLLWLWVGYLFHLELDGDTDI